MPVRLAETHRSADPADLLPDGAAAPVREDLSAFFAIRRWGPPPDEPEAPQTEPDAEAGPALHPVLARMGFVGLITTQASRAVLLAMPEGDIVRVLPGDTVPDGRTLVSVTDNSLTLEDEGGRAEVLTLFPPLPEAAVPSALGPGGPAQSREEHMALPGEAEASVSR